MPKANRVCKYCGEEYYVCYSCVKLNSYKKLFCSAECYRKFLAEQEKKENKNKHKKDYEKTFVGENEVLYHNANEDRESVE